MKNKKELLKELMRYKGSRKTLFYVILCMLFTASSPFLVSYMLERCIDSALMNELTRFIIFSLIFILVSLMCGIVNYHYGKQRQILAQEVASTLKPELFSSWLKAKHMESEQFSEGEVVTLINEDAEKCANFVPYAVMPFLEVVLSLLIGSFYALMHSWLIWGVVIGLTLVIIKVISNIMPKISAAYDKKQEKLDNQNSFWLNVLTGISLIRLNRLYKAITIFHKRTAGDRIGAEVRLEKEEAINQTIMDNGLLIIELIVLFIGIALVKNASISVGAMIGVWNASIGTMVYPMIDFPEVISKIETTLSSFKRLKPVLNLKPSPEPIIIRGDDHRIVMRNVFVVREGCTILNNINVKFESKKLYIIDGESGAGKTTIIRTLLGYLLPTNGEIIYDGQNKEDGNYNSFFSYMPQGNSMMQVSIGDNLRMGGFSFDKERTMELCEQLDVVRCINEKENGLDLIYGVDMSLSEGQAQRFALIRALLWNAPFLVLDEPFSALDDETAAKVAKLINDEKKMRGVIVVTHKYADYLEYDYKINLHEGEMYVKQSLSAQKI